MTRCGPRARVVTRWFSPHRPPPRRTPADARRPARCRTPTVKAALAAVKAAEARTLDEQVRALRGRGAAVQGDEARRAVRRRCSASSGLQNVRIDKAGNVLGERPGAQPRPHLVLAAHLDTVFPEGTDVKRQAGGHGDARPGHRRRLPRAGGGAGGRRALLKAGNVQTPGTITFVGNVGEEGLGDLRGVKHLFNEGLKGRVDRFVSIDGTGLGITHIAVGSLRYRVTFKGPGGHSYGAFGMANPIHALGRAMAEDRRLPGAARAEDHLQRRPHRRRHVGELDPVRGLDGSGHALGRRGVAAVARRQVPQGGRRRGGGRERALEQPRR